MGILNDYNNNHEPIIGIIGGSGLDVFSEISVQERVRPFTKYGYPSSEIIVGNYAGIRVAYLSRHGEKHEFPPHKIPYKANLAALKALGVKYIIASCMAGSLKKKIKPGSVVIIDQFVNLTWGRDDSFEADGGYSYVPIPHPYCKKLSEIIARSAKKIVKNVFTSGTAVIIQGPRFSTLAESKLFCKNHWDIVNMTQYPECYFAHELGLCYAAFAYITDYNVGVKKELTIEPENINLINQMFKLGAQKSKEIIAHIIKEGNEDISCNCALRAIEANERH